MIGIVTLYHENYQALADLVLPNWKRYCSRHGYQLLAHCGHYGGGQIGFEKMRYLRDVMNKDLEMALVVDLDVLFTNLEKRFTDFADGVFQDYLVTKDINGINNGSFIVRNTQSSRNLIDHIVRNVGNFTCEQNVLKEGEVALVGKELHILSHPSINSYLHPSMGGEFEYIYPEYKNVPFPNVWKEGDFLLHLPGMGLDFRLAVIKKHFSKFL